MIDGMSYLQLYYDKACTRELDKDDNDNYIYKSKKYSTSVESPLTLRIWCKNNGSHTAYGTKLSLSSSDILTILPGEISKILPGSIVEVPLSVVVLGKNRPKINISLRFEYDSI